MWMNKVKVAAGVVLAAALLLLGATVFAPRAAADKPAPAKDDKPAGAKDAKPEVGPTVQGTINNLDTKKKTIAVSVPTGEGKKTEEKTYTLGDDVKVILEDNLTKTNTPKEGKLADLTEGTHVSLQLAVDKKTVVAISARGPGIGGSVKAVDPSKNTITVLVKEDGGPAEKHLTVAEGARIIIDDGLGKKGDAPKEGKLSDLTEGEPVVVQLSVDRKTALGITVHGVGISGVLKGVDTGANTITLTVKEDGQLVEKTLSLAKDVRVDGGKLGDLTAGSGVSVTLSPVDKKTVVAVRVHDK
jgi:hypothetical protein